MVELVIVIAIVIVLSVVSVPIYRSYVDKAKMAEGYALLGTILTAQKAYYSEYGNFLEATHSSFVSGYSFYEPILGIDIRGNKYFTLFKPAASTYMDPRLYFSAYILKPKELRDNGFNGIVFRYNITSGSTITEE